MKSITESRSAQLRVEVVVAVVEVGAAPSPARKSACSRRAVAITFAPARRGDLHREVADPARAAVDQHVVALLHPDRVDDDLPGGQPGQRQRARLLDRERVRLVLEVARGRGHVLGVGARFAREPRHAEDFVADREAGDAAADRGDLAADVPADRERRPPSTEASLPSRVLKSTGLTPAARTRTWTSVGIGSGASTSSSRSTSGPPSSCWTIAFTARS